MFLDQRNGQLLVAVDNSQPQIGVWAQNQTRYLQHTVAVMLHSWVRVIDLSEKASNLVSITERYSLFLSWCVS